MKTNPIRMNSVTVSKTTNPNLPLVSGKAARFFFKARNVARLLSAVAFTALVAALASQPATAATITWGTATTIGADTDVITNGTALYAYSGGLATATTNVNGATFTQGSGFAAWGNVSFTSGFTANNTTAFGVATSPFQDLSPAYTNVLRGAAYGGTAAGTVTLNGLTVGHDYSVQIWVNDSRSAGSGRTETISSSAVTLDYNNYDAAGGVGQYVVGYFAADSTSQAFVMTPSASGSVQLNAISVRDNGLPLRTWLGSSSTSWGTAGNWSPASVPLPGDAIIFNNLSTANLVTVPDVSYAISTLTLSNTTSAISIGGANAMTVSGGINLIGSSQSLTITAPLVFSASQTWNVTNSGSTLAVNGGLSGSGALTISGGGTVSLGGAATYTGNTVITAGKLVIGSGGSLASANITIAGGVTFDVSATSYALSGGTLKNSSAGVVINGTSDGSSGTISMTYDGVNPPFVQTNGTLTLSGSTVINVNNTGAVLGTGNHTIIAAATAGNIGQVTGSLPGVNLTGNGAVGAVSLEINGSGGLDLVVGVADVWTGASDNSWLTGGNWTTASSPNPSDPVLFNNLSTANLSTVLNADFILSGVTVIDPSGPVTIGGANNLGISASGINLSSASQNLTIAAPVNVLADQPWNIATNRTLNINGGASGVSGVTITGTGAVNFNSAATYVGDTTISSGSKLKMTTANVLPNGPGTGNMTVTGLLDLNGNSEGIGALNGSGVVDNTSGSSATLTIGANSANGIFNGIIQNTGGALTLQVAGGDVKLLSTNTYSGGTTFNGGTLSPSASSSLGTGPVAFNPGSGTYTYGCTFTNTLFLNDCYLRIGGNNDNQIWSGPVTVTNGFQMSGDNGFCQIFLSGSMNIGTGGISVTNSGNSGATGRGASGLGDILSGPISGSGGIIYYCNGGNSRITVQGANTYTGGTIVNGTGNGKLNIVGGSNPFSTGTVTLNAGANIEAYNGNATITNALTLNGGLLESEPLYNNYNTLTWAGPITLTANSTILQGGTTTSTGNGNTDNQSSGVVVSGSLNINGYTLGSYGNYSFYGPYNTISGSISGTGNIQVTNNALTISGSNTFSGTFRAVGGTLSVNNVYALQNATLDMNAADSGAVTLNNINAVIGALTGSRNLNLGSGTVSIGNNNASTTFSGGLTNSGSLTKIGTGTLTLSANAYTGNTTINGGTLSIAQPALAVSSTVTVDGGAFLNLGFSATNVVTALVLNGVSQPNGVYKAANSGGRITGIGAIQVGITPDVWTGALSSEWSINLLSSPKNWKYNSAQTNYTDGSAVLFDDSLTGNSTVDISVANVTPVVVTFNNNTTNYTIQGTAAIAGSASLTKSGTGTVTILNTNTYTGNTTVSGGRVTIGANGNLGNRAYAGGIAIASGAIFEYGGTNSAGQTLSGPITGAGALLLDSTNAATVTLSSTANSYSGVTTVSNLSRLSIGTANISSNTTFNVVGGSTSGGQLYLSTAAATVSNSFTISGVGYTDAVSINVGAIRMTAGQTLAGAITLAGNSRIGAITGSQSFTILSRITGGFGLDIYGAANANSAIQTFTLANTGTPSDYTGNTTLYNNYFNNGFYTSCQTILRLGASEQIPNGVGKGILSFNGFNANRLCVLELNGFNETVNGITNTTSGPFSVIQNTNTGASVLTIGDGNTTSAYSGIITDGGVGKTLAINKIGSGTLSLSGTNFDTYIGGTTINGGALLINNVSGSGTGTGAVNINSGGTLGGTGTITGLVTNNSGGSLSPGVGGSGKLTLSGNVILLSGSTNTFTVNGSTPTNNSVVVGAAVTYGGVLNIVTNGTFTVGQTFTLFSGTGATNTGNFASIAGSPGAGKAFSFTNGVLSVITLPSGPTLTSVTPNPLSGSGYGATLNLTGSGFTGATAVLLTNVTATAGASYAPTVNSDTSISVRFVPGTAATTWNATVVNGSPSAQVAFTVTAPAKVTINPANLNSAGAGKLVLSGTGGVVGNSYAVQTATNLNSPIVWTSVVTNTFNGSGNFSYTNTVSIGTPQLFLRLAQ